MFSRVILRRINPAAAASSQADDIETQPLSPREPSSEREMSQRSESSFASVVPRSMSRLSSRSRSSSSTEATSAVTSEWPGSRTARASRSHVAPANPRPESGLYDDDMDDLEVGPGTPQVTTLPSRYSVVLDLPSTRLDLQGLKRNWSHGSSGAPTSRTIVGRRMPPREPQSPACRAHTPPIESMAISQPQQARIQPNTSRTRLGSAEADALYPTGRRHSRGGFTAPDEAENQLAEMAEEGRRRQRRTRDANTRNSQRRRSGDPPEEAEERRRRRRERRQPRSLDDDDEGTGRRHPNHFLFCFPWVKSRKLRSQILQCFVSGLFLLALLTIYLALLATHNITNSEFSLLLVLLILFAAIFFFQGLIRLVIQILRPKPIQQRQRSWLSPVHGAGGYAVPRQPIRVVLARDEEAVGIESEATKVNPPAYGLWRESVRVDPNRIFWQRNAEAASPAIDEERTLEAGESETEGPSSTTAASEESSSTQQRHGRRPPSYASEDGVSYVVEARPRSIAPSSNVQIVSMPPPLPHHPS
ncbi:hypothetical protein BD289DRAFT_81382 [Coniella lustricola]|uniref:Uncharacterized protein n=1 Tax=Coniella lustricola TaxID=2025994 RepID=A0A2T3AH96_9PEZI|nr:hypothetical protein BD289DRAFT_81382 [Coniella lustricola]